MSSSDITRVLTAIDASQASAEELLPLVYAELRRLAAAKLAHERPGQTLQPTALVHEAWLRLAKDTDQHWQGQRHFFLAAAEAMRRILVENARRKKSLKHGGGMVRVELEDTASLAVPMPDDTLLALDEALNRLTDVSPRAAAVVKLCFFAGLSQEQAAQSLGIAPATLKRTWTFARAWLYRQLTQDGDTGGKPLSTKDDLGASSVS